MDRKQLTAGLSEIGLGVILFVTALELPYILTDDTTMELLIFFIRVLSYISIVIGFITTIMAIIPEVKKQDKKEESTRKKE
jgi:hypothetical protein